MSRCTRGIQAGTVYLVGGGPGAPGLLTARASQVLAVADVVVYDRLISPRLLSMASNTAEFIYVGKEAGHHAMKQHTINDLLVDLAFQGKQVVRLKGGDPFVFGRGGEEGEACLGAGVPIEVVPGITSPVAVSAYAGIPVTHRGVSTSFTVITGHQCEAGRPEDVDWRSLRSETGTLVILMGISRLDKLTQCLLSLGRNADTPVALIRWGTRADQAVLTGSLGTICRRVEETSFQPPAIIVVGDVVNLRDTLQWFEQRPLFGRRVLVAADTTKEGRRMAESLEALGAETVDISVEQGTRVNRTEIQRMLSRPLSPQSSLYFCNVQAVHQFFAVHSGLDLDVRTLAKYQFGARNTQVAQALNKHRVTADFIGTPDKSLLASMDGYQHTEFQVDVARVDGGVTAEIYRFCNTEVNTSQLQAIVNACDTPFDLCWSTSAEASRLIQRLQTYADKLLVRNWLTRDDAPEPTDVQRVLGDDGRQAVEAVEVVR
ncbi:uroporphyrinogen-III C-methyltransferase [Alicyclobacillus ferrooxydans]|uniref:uroporphyrinogen-III C-methyltransferase n=1 Tax=Alicyclobacillus ferrooxydans TaxID=471514 RepID=UPI0006D578FA|nr:uroporphyrinogen-III C-methyltransferase [Alicyclobacillus ferrooxydans]